MKQKIVVKVQMTCQKCRIKALGIAASADGVEKVSIEGEGKDRVVVIGDGVDSIRLAKSLRKKVGHSEILTLDEVKPAKDGKNPSSYNPITYPLDLQAYQYHPHPQFVGYNMVYEPTPSYCSLM